ncbi:hypothetical protein BB558_006191 [Smittium angustum]|uniref:Integrase catalytic domain-containing protein n=1 Tax=Smittium angustum TaxID=133377 RepID=A0A2U1IYE1_SMIAN|nr:hypothetical protein BB558_006191 [Smittium angustum]
MKYLEHTVIKDSIKPDMEKVEAVKSLADPKNEKGRWAIKLRNYDFTVKHKQGALNPADFISKFPWKDIPAEMEPKPVTAYRPSANGQMEQTIQTLKQTLRKMEDSDTNIHSPKLRTSSAEIVYGMGLMTPSIWGCQVTTDISKEEDIQNRKKWLYEKTPGYQSKA